VFWLGACKFGGPDRVGVRFANGSKRFIPITAVHEVVNPAPAADPRRRNGFLRVEDMTPAERAEHEECMANMPIRAMCREMVRGIGGDQAADEFERMIDSEY
jgi:hypothetical protein